ncbi:MAG: hypothetical protein QOE72_3302 [Chloroflexota bacterium]|nr:hypothetical protein [Chloroflexota bacterium]
MSAASAGPVGERRNLRLRRLRDTVAARYGVPPAALAALDGSTVTKMAALQERRILHFRIERAGVPPGEGDATAGLVPHGAAPPAPGSTRDGATGS